MNSFHSSSTVGEHSPRFRLGFTLVELLVVITIIGVLISLLLPAINAAREAARRSECQNNLSQLILAVHSYENAHEVFPAGVINAQGPIRNTEQGYHLGWIARILPYIEEQTTYKHIDFSQSAYHKKNEPVRSFYLEILQCPSYPGALIPSSHYAACHHDMEAPIDKNNHGVFFLNSRVRYHDISDGTTHTIFLGEKMSLQSDNDLGWISGTRSTLRNTGTPPNAALSIAQLADSPGWDMVDENAIGFDRTVYDLPESSAAETEAKEDCTELPQAPEPPEAATASEGAPDSDSKVTSPNVPPDSNPDSLPGLDGDMGLGGEEGDMWTLDPEVEKSFKTNAPLPPLYVGGFSGSHPGIVLFAFGDGSVRLINEGVDPKAYRQMGHRADGQLRVNDVW